MVNLERKAEFLLFLQELLALGRVGELEQDVGREQSNHRVQKLGQTRSFGAKYYNSRVKEHELDQRKKTVLEKEGHLLQF